MEQQDEDRQAWIREQLGDEEIDENSAEWEQLSEAYDEMLARTDTEEYYDDWSVQGKSRLDLFNANIQATIEVLELSYTFAYQKNVLVMLHTHVITALEAYLSSTFIEFSLSNDDFMQKLVETDPEIAKQKFTLKELFTKRESLKDDLQKYLKDLIFHDIAKVKEMYLSVLDIDFGEVDWLFKAVNLRHDCVHRAGYDKEGNEVELTGVSITELINHSLALVQHIESVIISLPTEFESIWDPI